MPFNLAAILPFLQFGSGALGILDQQRLDAEASEANEARFQQILGELGGPGQKTGLYGRVMPAITRLVADAKKSGDVERRDLARQYTSLESQGLSDLTRAGLGGTTAASSLRMGYGRERQSATDRLNEQLKAYNFSIGQLPSQYDVNLTQNRTGVIERKNDVAGTSPATAWSQLFGAAIPAPTVDQPKDRSIIGPLLSSIPGALGDVGAAAVTRGGR